MTMFEVLERRGTWVLLRFAGAVACFLLLHLIRIPFVLVVRVLEVAMRRADAAATRTATQVPRGPINHWFPPHQTGEEEFAHAHA